MMFFGRQSALKLLLVLTTTTQSFLEVVSSSSFDAEYANQNYHPSLYRGVEDSWPMQQKVIYFPDDDDDDASFKSHNGNYEHYMRGCFEMYSQTVCLSNEEDRLERNRNQPPLQTNFTHAGYAKVAAPKEAFAKLQKFWKSAQTQLHHHQPEAWTPGSIFVNHWEAPTHVLPYTDTQELQTQVQGVLSRWMGKELTPTSVYGIRVYGEGSILAPHIDRLPLVISAVINVAQDVRTDWPLELISHLGQAVNVTLQPGEMLLYEGHSILHGRPFPLDGTYYANIFLHFEPVGYTMELEQRLLQQQQSSAKTPKQKYAEALERWSEQYKPQEKGPNLPPYIPSTNTKAAVRWRQEFVYSKEEESKKEKESKTTGVTTAHYVAAHGGLATLKSMGADDPSVLHQADGNGWRPVHEAARSGHTPVLEYLIEQGVDLNDRTNFGKGGTPLWWAEHMLPHDHKTIQLLRKHGAVSIGPGDPEKNSKDAKKE